MPPGPSLGNQTTSICIILSFYPDGTGAFADEITELFIILTQLELRPVRAGLAPGRLDQPDGAPLDFIWHDDGVVVRLDGAVSEVENLLLDGVYAAGIKPFGGQNRLSVLLSNSDHDITAAQIVEVVGKGADRVQRAEGVPPLLELQPLPFDTLAAEQFMDIDW